MDEEGKEIDALKANNLKEEGNFFLSHHLYASAVEKYSAAIALAPTAVFYANRAQAYIKLEQYGSAIEDANSAVQLDSSYIKSYYRRASANYALGKLKDAQRDLKTVVKIVPADPDAKKKLKACEKALREEAFNKAIEVEEQVSPLLDIASIAVDASYSGPRLRDDSAENIDAEFVSQVLEHMRAQKLVHRKYVLLVLTAARTLFRSLPSLLRINISPTTAATDTANTTDAVAAAKADSSAMEADGTADPTSPSIMSSAATAAEVAGPQGRITVCGDTHGQYYDLLNIFSLAGQPSAANPYLFNGDYVDRGSFSFETVFALLCTKLACPAALHMLRGNHETRNMNKMYGFEGEVLHKYDATVMRLFTEVFNSLPLAAVIQDRVFVVHGGLSTQDAGRVALSDIEALPRFREPPESGLFSDLLWADPQPESGRSFSKRGMGFSFGHDYTARFLEHNSLQLVIRSHEVKDEGYECHHDNKCITVFSAPNYCDQMGNKGAYIVLDLQNDLQPQFHQFLAVPHPNVPPMSYAGNVFGL